jgi:pyruvate dehydrogenase E2 component (dihydrolipoamide acetyltransferase)
MADEIDTLARPGRGEVTYQEPTRLQQTVSRRMAESKATAPDVSLSVAVNMEALAGEAHEAFVIRAAALALRDFPRANAAYRDGRFELYSRVNVGVVLAGQDAFAVPTIFDADAKSVDTIARELASLAARVRAGEITPPELSAGTFTVFALGVRRFTPILNPPQAAILGVGEVAPRAVVVDGAVVARHVAELTLVCDHRILYGEEAAAFLGRVREYLEAPQRL